ncbi:MAG TPA: hypothetical protein VN253_29775 [Kofleriaceae bacterium]|nr:hypothetical protein [Kofleriaceae bacterium]
MKRSLAASALLLITLTASLTAFAGKEEREYAKNELTPAVKAAETKFKEACGCALKINISDTLKSVDDMRQAKYISAAITDGAPGYCNDAESKKAMCVLKTLDIVKSGETKFTFKGGKGTAATDGNSYVSWDMITREIDK